MNLAADWMALVGLNADRSLDRAPALTVRAASGARRLVHEIDRHPNIALTLTLAAFFVLFIGSPEAAILLLIAAPLFVGPIAVAQIYRRRRRVGRRRWAPTAAIERPPVESTLSGGR